MDRLDFCKSIDIDPALQVKDYFNELMGMYNMVENIDYEYISGSINQESNIQFTIGFKSPELATYMRSTLVGKRILLYYKFFDIIETTEKIDDTELSIVLKNI